MRHMIKSTGAHGGVRHMCLDLKFYRPDGDMRSYWRHADLTPKQAARLLPYADCRNLRVEWGLYLVPAEVRRNVLVIYVGGCW